MPRKSGEPWNYDPADLLFDGALDDGDVLYYNATNGKLLNVPLSIYSVVIAADYSAVITDVNGIPLLTRV